ncbi:RNA polymerase-binding transcription factor DksA [compost metagenome]
MSTLEKQKANQNLYGVAPYQETKGEEYMGEPMRKHFTKILTGWKQELMVGVDKTVDHMKEEAANFADPADRASQEEEFALELRNRDRERKLIKKIDKTLQKIQDEEYGWCESCGIEIGLRRLEARPTADLCVDCKEIAEKKEKTVGKG